MLLDSRIVDFNGSNWCKWGNLKFLMFVGWSAYCVSVIVFVVVYCVLGCMCISKFLCWQAVGRTPHVALYMLGDTSTPKQIWSLPNTDMADHLKALYWSWPSAKRLYNLLRWGCERLTVERLKKIVKNISVESGCIDPWFECAWLSKE